MPNLSVSCELWSSSHVPVLPPPTAVTRRLVSLLELVVSLDCWLLQGGVSPGLCFVRWTQPWGVTFWIERVPAPPGSASFPADDKNNLWSYTWAI